VDRGLKNVRSLLLDLLNF